VHARGPLLDDVILGLGCVSGAASDEADTHVTWQYQWVRKEHQNVSKTCIRSPCYFLSLFHSLDWVCLGWVSCFACEGVYLELTRCFKWQANRRDRAQTGVGVGCYPAGDDLFLRRPCPSAKWNALDIPEVLLDGGILQHHMGVWPGYVAQLIHNIRSVQAGAVSVPALLFTKSVRDNTVSHFFGATDRGTREIVTAATLGKGWCSTYRVAFHSLKPAHQSCVFENWNHSLSVVIWTQKAWLLHCLSGVPYSPVLRAWSPHGHGFTFVKTFEIGSLIVVF